MTRRASRRRDSFSASMKRKRIDLRDSFRAMPNMATGSRGPAFAAFMKSILCEGTDRNGAILLPARGKMLCIPNAAITIVRGPRRLLVLVALARCDRLIRTGETVKIVEKDAARAGRFALTRAL